MNHLRAAVVNTGCQKRIPNLGINPDELREQIGGGRTYGNTTGKLKFRSPSMATEVRTGKEIIYFFSYDGSFSVFFYVYASQFYDASFFYHKAYSNIFLKMFINKFI